MDLMGILCPTRIGWRGTNRRMKEEPRRGSSWRKESKKHCQEICVHDIVMIELYGSKRSRKSRSFFSETLKKSRSSPETRCLESKKVSFNHKKSLFQKTWPWSSYGGCEKEKVYWASDWYWTQKIAIILLSWWSRRLRHWRIHVTVQFRIWSWEPGKLLRKILFTYLRTRMSCHLVVLATEPQWGQNRGN